MDALAEVAGAVKGRVSLIVDSGARRGGDVVTALALGAQAAAVGRATLYGAAAGGQAGAQRAVDILVEELLRTMQLCGAGRIADIGPALPSPKMAHL